MLRKCSGTVAEPPSTTAWDDPTGTALRLNLSPAEVAFWLRTVDRTAHDAGQHPQAGCPGCPPATCACGDPDCREYARHRLVHAGAEVSWLEPAR